MYPGAETRGKLALVFYWKDTDADRKFISVVDQRDALKEKLLRQIILLDHKRILLRLSSKHAPKSQRNALNARIPKPPPTKLLQRVTDKLAPGPTLDRNQIDDLRSKQRALSASFKELEDSAPDLRSSDTQDVIIRILKEAHSLSNSRDREAALGAAGSSSSVGRTLGKLGRYYSCSRDLINLARSSEYTIFQEVSVEPTPKLEREYINPNAKTASFDHVFDRLSRLSQPTDLREAARRCTGQALQNVRQAFEDSVAECTLNPKVHAEVQLLFFYESRPDIICYPRILCSSKSACYMCDLFVKVHGKHSTPRTHGKLYGKWVLPAWEKTLPASSATRIRQVTEQFTETVERKIINTLQGRLVRRPDANESVLSLRVPFAPSSTILAGSGPELHPVSPASLASGQLGQPPTSLAMTSPEDDPSSPFSPVVDAVSVPASAPSPQSFRCQTPLIESPASISSLSTPPAGNVLSHDFRLSGEQLQVRHNTLEVFVSCDTPMIRNVEDASSYMTTCSCQILKHNAYHDVSSEGTTLVEISTMKPGLETRVQAGAVLSPRSLVIQNQSDVLEIKYNMGKTLSTKDGQAL